MEILQALPLKVAANSATHTNKQNKYFAIYTLLHCLILYNKLGLLGDPVFHCRILALKSNVLFKYITFLYEYHPTTCE